MINKENLRFFITNGRTLEFREMCRFLSRHGYHFEITDLYSSEFIEKLPDLAQEYTVVLVGWNLSVIRNGVVRISLGRNRLPIILPSETVVLSTAVKNCLYRQILRFLQIIPSSYQKKIFANAEKGIEGLFQLGLPIAEIIKIRRQEYTLSGFKSKDFAILAADLSKAKIHQGLFEIEVEKKIYVSAIHDEAFVKSFGRPRKLDLFVTFRDGSPSYYYGRSEFAYSLYETFQGIYSGNEDWSGCKETTEEVRNYLYSLYSK